METLKYVGLLLLGVLVFVWGTVNVRDSYVSRKWPSTEGVILSSRVHQVGRLSRSTFYPRVDYMYFVNATRYQANNISAGQDPVEWVLVLFGDYLGTSLYSKRIARRYPAGLRVTVYYNPDRPQVALLEPGFSWGSFVAMAGGVALMVFGGGPLFGYEPKFWRWVSSSWEA